MAVPLSVHTFLSGKVIFLSQLYLIIRNIELRSPANSGTVFHNYKGFFSIILLGFVDAEYKFLWVDVGANGSSSDCAVFSNSDLKAALDADDLGLPTADELPGNDVPVPYFMVGDDAFSLKTYMMKPFSTRNPCHAERIFNY